MFGSHALDTLIGLTLLMAVVSLLATTVVEGIATILNKRGKDLKDAMNRIVGEDVAADGPADGALSLDQTVAIGSLRASPRREPSYIPPSAFVDGVSEMIQSGSMPENVERALAIVARERGADRDAMVVALNRYYDAAMERVTGVFKRWSMLWLFGIGLGVAVAGNISVFHVAESLWTDSTTREAVVASATGVSEDGLDPSELESVGATIDTLEYLDLPVGWTEEARSNWGPTPSWQRLGVVVGWLATGALTMLGAQFWFDLLKRLVSLRGSGSRPEESQARGRTPGTDVAPAAALLLAGPAAVPDGGAMALAPDGGRGGFGVDGPPSEVDLIRAAFGAVV